MSNELHIRSFRPNDEAAVVALWRDCQLTRPWNDPLKDIQRKLGVQPHMFLVGLLRDKLVASIMAGYDGHRGWIYYLAVAPKCRHRGFARQMMAEAERLLLEAGCPKISLLIRTDNESAIAFYHRIGFTVDEVTSMGKRLIPDN